MSYMGTVTFRLPDAVLAAVDERAVAERRSRSDVIRLAVEAAVGVSSGPVVPRADVAKLRKILATPAAPVRVEPTPVPADEDLDSIA